MGLAALHAPDQIDPRGDVPPLIAAAHLDGALLFAEQVQEVVRLQQHVAEFGVGDAGVEARLHRLLLQHQIDGEVLADVPQESDERLLLQPVGIVEHEGPRLFRVEIEEPAHLIALVLQVVADLLLGEEGALILLAARVADHPGAAAHQHDRAGGRPAAGAAAA